MKRGPLKIFYSYAHEDEQARDKLDEHLELLARRNLIIRWHDRHIVPGNEWSQAIQESLDEADIVLLLVSRAFMASQYINDVEIPEAMRAHASGRTRVVPLLVEDVPEWQQSQFARLQLLPRNARPIADWEDPVDAYAHIAHEIEQVVKEIIIEGGGPFEFGAHRFSEAELSQLPMSERERTAQGLLRLRKVLDASIPSRTYESNLLIANWSLRKFGARKSEDSSLEALHYMAQVISAWDLVALQEVDRNLDRLESLMKILGPDWNYLISGVAPGNWGNNERFAILYYTPRVEFRNLSGQVILPPEKTEGLNNRAAQQLARPPMLAAFRSGDWEFHLCTTHILYGGGNKPSALQARYREVEKLCKYLMKRAKSDQTDLLLMGDFQLEHPGSPIHQILLENGVEIPEETLHPAHIRGDHYFSLIGFLSGARQMPLGPSQPRSGFVDLYRHVFREKDFAEYADDDSLILFTQGSYSLKRIDQKELKKHYKQWKTYQISDHFPIWVELALP